MRDLILESESPEILSAPKYKERVIIKMKSNREKIKQAVQDKTLLVITEEEKLEDSGMRVVSEYLEGILEHAKILSDLTVFTSTISQFQAIYIPLLNELKTNLSDQNKQIMKDKSTLQLKHKMSLKCPLMYSRLDKISNMEGANGILPRYVKQLYVDILTFCLQYYNKCPDRQNTDYSPRVTGESKSLFFPNLPLIRQKARYEADTKESTLDKEATAGCVKLFSESKKHTGGLFLLTCCCPNKRIYGFQKIINGESPRIVVDLALGRFPQSYNPTIVYDTPCKVVEVGLNREPKRIMNLRIVSDPLHADNHTACCKSFSSRMHTDLNPLNKEACEQFNSLLRSVQSSVSYMTYDNYLQSIKIFIAFYNMRGIESK